MFKEPRAGAAKANLAGEEGGAAEGEAKPAEEGSAEMDAVVNEPWDKNAKPEIDPCRSG